MASRPVHPCSEVCRPGAFNAMLQLGGLAKVEEWIDDCFDGARGGTAAELCTVVGFVAMAANEYFLAQMSLGADPARDSLDAMRLRLPPERLAEWIRTGQFSAMAAGLTDQLMGWENIIAIMDDAEMNTLARKRASMLDELAYSN